MAESKGVDAVERAFAVLHSFEGAGGGLTLAELARRTGLYKSTILRLSVSLERLGYVMREADGRFRLGPAAWRLGVAYRRSFAAGETIRPELQRLAAETGETASFYVREGDSRICLYRAEPVRAIRHAIREGERMPLDRGASGHVLAAWSGEGAGGEVRARGHAVSRGERDPEVAAVAVPLLDADGNLVGALSVSGPVTRYTDERVATILAALSESRARLGDAGAR